MTTTFMQLAKLTDDLQVFHQNLDKKKNDNAEIYTLLKQENAIL